MWKHRVSTRGTKEGPKTTCGGDEGKLSSTKIRTQTYSSRRSAKGCNSSQGGARGEDTPGYSWAFRKGQEGRYQFTN
jgi:hypothetical protein